jgi:hypothetical protein
MNQKRRVDILVMFKKGCEVQSTPTCSLCGALIKGFLLVSIEGRGKRISPAIGTHSSPWQSQHTVEFIHRHLQGEGPIDGMRPNYET